MNDFNSFWMERFIHENEPHALFYWNNARNNSKICSQRQIVLLVNASGFAPFFHQKQLTLKKSKNDEIVVLKTLEWRSLNPREQI